MRHFSLRHPFARSWKASVTPVDPRAVYRHRLERWATILYRNPDQLLWLQRNLEVLALEESWLMAATFLRLRRKLGALPTALQHLAPGQFTALTLAARDPELRWSGLTSDRYNSALRFFGLSDQEMHRILCYCAYGHESQVPARAIAGRIRGAAARRSLAYNR